MTTPSQPLAARPQRGDELELTVDSLAFGGAGVARVDGYVVFVAGGFPGDRVRAVVRKRKRETSLFKAAPTRDEVAMLHSLMNSGARPPLHGLSGAGR